MEGGMTHEERKALRRVLRILDAAGGGVQLPSSPANGGGSWSANIETAIRWLIRNDPPTKSTLDLMRWHRARDAEAAAFALTPEGQARRAATEALQEQAREALEAWSVSKLRSDLQLAFDAHVFAKSVDLAP
jgi:hypothetical protein